MESTKCELEENSIMPSSNYLVTSPVPIKALRDISHILKDKHRHLWKTAIYEQCDKNHKLLVPLVPFPIYDVPRNKKILRPVLVSTVKTSPSEPEICDLRIRLCANGAD